MILRTLYGRHSPQTGETGHLSESWLTAHFGDGYGHY